MAKAEDLVGKKFGRWTVQRKADHHDTSGKVLWECRCDCGNTGEVTTGSLKSGNSKSCGCFKRERTSATKSTHGMSGKRLYTIWQGAKKRCENPNCVNYKNYGKRGITICEEWKGEHGFEHFRDWAVSHGYADNLTLDRVDYNGNYEPSNCRWVSQKEQCNNTRKNHYITIEGVTHTMKEWSEITQIPYSCIRARVNSYNCVGKSIIKPI